MVDGSVCYYVEEQEFATDLHFLLNHNLNVALDFTKCYSCLTIKIP